MSSSRGRVKTDPRIARPTSFSEGLTGDATARAASMIAPYWTPEGHAVRHARQSRQAKMCSRKSRSSGVQYGAIIEAARAVASPVNPSEKLVGRAILGSVFTRPRLLDIAGFGLRFYQRSGLQALMRRSGVLRVLPMRLQEMEAMLAPTQGGLFRWRAPTVTPG